MKNRKSNDIMINERGYAMIEVVFAITVIAILASVVLPKIEAAFKTVYVDYEIRNLYGEMRFMQAANRISSFKTNEGWELVPRIDHL
ncbi:MAG: type II secretion system protein [Selenomonadaceae bacterium]|nr:type II secretion system protein [Selenomonadaceae bacterium]